MNQQPIPTFQITSMQKEFSLINQFQQENEAYTRVLGFIEEENIHLMNRLPIVLNCLYNSNENTLERIEYFQNRFLEQDKTISTVAAKMAAHNKLLYWDTIETKEDLAVVKEKQNILRRELLKTEEEFYALKVEFNLYLEEIL